MIIGWYVISGGRGSFLYQNDFLRGSPRLETVRESVFAKQDLGWFCMYKLLERGQLRFIKFVR